MKSFSYQQVDKRLNKKSQKQVNEEKMRENFLKLYDDIPPDPKMEKYCEDVKQEFYEKRKNSRYYSYQLREQEKNPVSALRTQNIKKLINYKMPYKSPQTQSFQRNSVQPLVTVSRSRLSRSRPDPHLAHLFRQTIKSIIKRLKKMNLTLQQIFTHSLFPTPNSPHPPYKFGQQLFHACKQSNPQKVFVILLKNRYSIFSIDNSGKTALFWACIRNNLRIVEMLLKAGIDGNKKDQHGCNALSYCVRYGRVECGKRLGLEMVEILDDVGQKDRMNRGKKEKSIEKIGTKDGKGQQEDFQIERPENLEEMRNVISICKKFYPIWKGIDDISKREQIFNEQYQYLYGQK